MEHYKKIVNKMDEACREFGYICQGWEQGGDVYIGKDVKYCVTVHNKEGSTVMSLTIMSDKGNDVKTSDLIKKFLGISN